MSASKFRPPGAFVAHHATPRTVGKGQRSRWVEAVGHEDSDEAVRRVASYPWAASIVGRPVRIGQRWQFVCRVTA